jgi:ubiquinone/menaquinone biosynthesis C-methylase UbiE
MTEQSGWQLSGSAPEAYERYLAAPLLSPCAPGLIEAAAMTSGERVLDVACGTGTVARCAAHRVGTTGRVTGIDLNTGMLAMALQEMYRVLVPGGTSGAQCSTGYPV